MHLFGAGSAKPKTGVVTGSNGQGHIKDGSLETFTKDVIEASMTTPVLVDFWAPWCGPCKQLTPTLEKVVKAANGKVKLVKINVDENPELSAQLRIQSIPTVYAFVGGQPVTAFAGAQPESQIKALIDKLVGAGGDGVDEVAADLDAAREAAEAGDVKTAAAIYNALLQDEPENPEAIGGLARCLIGAQQLDDAEKWLAKVPKEHVSHAAVTGARAALALAKESGALGDMVTLLAKLDGNPDDHKARYDLATVLFLRGQIEPAMDHLCRIVKADRTWQEDGARKQLVKFFEALGPKHPATLKGRRMLSQVLFS